MLLRRQLLLLPLPLCCGWGCFRQHWQQGYSPADTDSWCQAARQHNVRSCRSRNACCCWPCCLAAFGILMPLLLAHVPPCQGRSPAAVMLHAVQAKQGPPECLLQLQRLGCC